MNVQEVMTSEVWSVPVETTLHEALRLMWEHDIGSLPVVDAQRRVVGMITDRDAAMATYLRGCAPAEIPVRDTMSANVCACRPEDSIAEAEQMMRTGQIRRLPVTDAAGQVLGMISLADLALHATEGVRIAAASGLVRTLGAIAHPRTEAA